MNYLRSHLFLAGTMVLAIIVVAFCVWIVMEANKTNQNTQPQAVNNTNSEVVKTDKAVNEVPDKFPADMPIETGAKIVQNYNATTKDGRFQATRVFETKKTLADNLKIYQTYLKSNDYKVQQPVETDKFVSILGTKGQIQIQISMDENSVTGIKTVSISLTELSK